VNTHRREFLNQSARFAAASVFASGVIASVASAFAVQPPVCPDWLGEKERSYWRLVMHHFAYCGVTVDEELNQLAAVISCRQVILESLQSALGECRAMGEDGRSSGNMIGRMIRVEVKGIAELNRDIGVYIMERQGIDTLLLHEPGRGKVPCSFAGCRASEG
jgi:hypothetical protein